MSSFRSVARYVFDLLSVAASLQRFVETSSAEEVAIYDVEGQALGNLVISVITATTFIVQIIGPMFVKLAIVRSGEINMAVIEDLYG